MTNPFREPGCSCHDTAGLLRDVFGGRQPMPCTVHDSTVDREAEARDAALERFIAEDRAAAAVAKREANQPPTVEQLLMAALRGEYDPPPVPGLAPVIPLNSHPSQFPALAGLNTDPPPNAAA